MIIWKSDSVPGWRNQVDATDLKSVGHFARVGSIPTPGTDNSLLLQSALVKLKTAPASQERFL